MKSRLRLFGIIAFVVLAGFSMAACTNPIDPPGTDTIPNPPNQGITASPPLRAVPQPHPALTLQNMTDPNFDWAPLIMASYTTGTVNRYVIRAGVVGHVYPST